MRPAASPPAGVELNPQAPWIGCGRPAASASMRTGANARLGELRGRVDRAGPAALDSAEALELFLARSGARDAASLTAALLARFGSLPEILGAPLPELRQVAPRRIALEIRLFHDLARRMLEEPLRRRTLLASWSQVVAYLRLVLAAEPREQFRVLFLDKKNQLIAEEVMGWGSVDHAPVYPREVVRRALELSASALILAHNHPSRDPTPSAADVEMTRKVIAACRALGLTVHDHVVVGGSEAASLKALGLI